MIRADYIQRTYSGWLGKVIGIRMGAPIENWSKEKIEQVYGKKLTDYLVSYEDFATDDDSNGPLFFVRGLEHYENLTAEAMGYTFLNYIPKEHGFFWWGEELSTEHTAFKNLYAGIMAPESGNASRNGIQMAEQIGGQIFIDGFGFVAPGNPKLAADLAESSARVTHDLDGVAGARFIAACIALAYERTGIVTIMKEALEYVGPSRHYHEVILSMIECYESGQSWEEAFQRLRTEFWTDCYGGVCHMIPNAGIIAIALLYGNGDFLASMELVNRLGFDTDCNAGNLGAILGVYTNQIPEHLITPIRDVLLASSIVGSLNVTTISESTLLFCKLGYELAGEDMPEPFRQYWYELEQNGTRIAHFEFEGALHGFRVKASYKNAEVAIRRSDECAFIGKHSLKLTINNLHPLNEVYLYQKTYYQPEDLHDSRYQPCFSPIASTGDIVSCKLYNATGQKLRAYLYAYDCNEEKNYRFAEGVLTGEWIHLEGRIPYYKNARIKELGVIIRSEEEIDTYFGEQVVVYQDCFTIQAQPQITCSLANHKVEDYSLHGVKQYELAGFTHYLPSFEGIVVTKEGIQLQYGEAIYTGDYYWRDYSYEVSLSEYGGGRMEFLFRCQGNLRAYSARYEDETLSIVKYHENNEMILASIHTHRIPNQISASVKGSHIKITCHDCSLEAYDEAYVHGGIGMKVSEGGQMVVSEYTVNNLS